MDSDEKTIELMLLLLDTMQAAEWHIDQLKHANYARVEETAKALDSDMDSVGRMRARGQR